LFGARGTGKTSLSNELFDTKSTLWFDLLDDEMARKLSVNPQIFFEQIKAQSGIKWVVVDEIQKVPALLDYIHKLIEDDKIKFVLTGSSARKLKRQGSNLLAGRAFINHLHPLSYFELEADFKLDQVLNWGSLPKIYQFEKNLEKEEFLISYVNTYIRQEIKEEQLVRRIEPFLKFLEVAAQANGKILNYSKDIISFFTLC
jgi:predicted AAA+ superfamily ATPase